jgi:GNAT superfamily N-acetyltransferase
MLKIYQAVTDQDKDNVRQLFWEYLNWANQMLNAEYDIDFDIKQILDSDMQDLGKFYPPHGRLLLAEQDGSLTGLACMHKIKPDIGEIKRMYVREEFRRLGIGRALLDKLIAEAMIIGYAKLRLDSTRFMHAAHALYRAMGFYEISPYGESEIPSEFHSKWIFMELNLELRNDAKY